MADAMDKIQAIVNEVYDEWNKEGNKGKIKWDVLNEFSPAHQIAVVFGNFNYQVENGGLEQWIYNGYLHDDSEKLTEYLEIGAESDERCRAILDKVYTLNQYAQETDCDRYGNYYAPEDDGDSSFIGDMIDCYAFDSWYYEHCGKDDWWETVAGIIEKADGRDLSLIIQDDLLTVAAAPAEQAADHSNNYMIKNTTTDEIRRMAGSDGLIFQGCAGDPKEWHEGVNEMLTEAGILKNGGEFKDISVFEHEGLTNILFSLDSIEPADLDIGKLAVWRLQTHKQFGGTWLSDYITNKLGVHIDDRNPELEGAAPQQDEPSDSRPLRAYIENASDGDIGGFTIALPATQEELQQFFDDVEIKSRDDVMICDIESNIPELGDKLSAYVEGESNLETTLNELNYLAARVAGLDEDELDIFSANIEAGRNCDSIAEIINLTFEENLSRFDIQPAFDAEMYGEFLVEIRLQDEHAAVFNRLNESKDPAERAFAAHIEKLEAHVDREEFGRAVAREEGGVFTDSGYLTGGDGVRELYRGAFDIPAEYRLTVAAPAGREKAQLSVTEEIAKHREAQRNDNDSKHREAPAPDKNKSNRKEER